MNARVAPLLWTAGITLAWPAVQLAVFGARFGRMDSGRLFESAIFVPMGLASAVALVWLYRRARGAAGRAGAIAGYLLAMPVAFIGGLLGGLIVHPLAGTLLLGALPLVAGAALGSAIGGLFSRPAGAGHVLPATH